MTASRAGSKDSYFSTMVFINGEIRPLGYNILNNILKVAVTQPSFDICQLIALYRVFASIPSEFVGYTGANFLYATYQKIDALITSEIQDSTDLVTAKEDFMALIAAFAQYVNLLNAQNLALFPWRHTTDYPIALAPLPPTGTTKAKPIGQATVLVEEITADGF